MKDNKINLHPPHPPSCPLNSKKKFFEKNQATPLPPSTIKKKIKKTHLAPFQ
jgi:hypothetical protein